MADEGEDLDLKAALAADVPEIYFNSFANYLSGSDILTVLVADPQATAEKVVSFARLPDGWDHGRGRPAHDRAVVSSLRALDSLRRLGFKSADAFPGTDGEVMVAVYRDDYCIEIVFGEHDRADMTIEKGGAVVGEADALTETELYSRIHDVVGRTWNSSGSSTPSTSIRRAGNSQAWRSRTRPEAASRSFLWRVSRGAEFRSATTSRPIIRNG